jgi:hypothetical protein
MYQGEISSVGPIVEALGASGGFSVTYPHVDRTTLGALRDYQRAIGTDYPGWISRVEFNPALHGLTVHVFPTTEIPRVALSFQPYYGRW